MEIKAQEKKNIDKTRTTNQPTRYVSMEQTYIKMVAIVILFALFILCLFGAEMWPKWRNFGFPEDVGRLIKWDSFFNKHPLFN